MIIDIRHYKNQKLFFPANFSTAHPFLFIHKSHSMAHCALRQSLTVKGDVVVMLSGSLRFGVRLRFRLRPLPFIVTSALASFCAARSQKHCGILFWLPIRRQSRPIPSPSYFPTTNSRAIERRRVQRVRQGVAVIQRSGGIKNCVVATVSENPSLYFLLFFYQIKNIVQITRQ